MAKGKVSLVPGFTHVREIGGIKEYRLTSNGMRVLLAHDAAVPVAGFMVTYHVGSKNEATGYTGATHLLEHLLFKGSERFNKKLGTSMDALMEGKGAVVNATTWFDRTNYYEVMPADALPLAIEIEADRMRTALFTEIDRASEMPIVRNEFERGENLPMEALDKEVWAAAFTAHPYHHSTIGWRSDIEGVSIQRLRQFYDEFYWPDNATATVAGSFDEERVLRLIKKEFSKHPAKKGPYPALYTTEPEQQGERRVRVERAGTNMLCLAHKIPEATHEDVPALMLLAEILSEGKTSRLYKAFVDTALATDVDTQCWQFQDPSLFESFITLAPKTAHEKAEALLRNEYQRIIEEGVTASELQHAKQTARAALAARRDGPYALLSSLNEEIATGDWTRFVTLADSLNAVTRTDIKRVAKRYFNSRTSVVGWFVNTAS